MFIVAIEYFRLALADFRLFLLYINMYCVPESAGSLLPPLKLFSGLFTNK